jgi:hypothetical protein
MTRSGSSFTRKQKDVFLAHLAETLNVSAAAKVAGIARARVYEERQKSDGFRLEWHEAQCAAYDRLNAQVYAEASRPATGRIKDMTLKEKQLKMRLAMSLLTRHGPTVLGPAPTPAHPGLPRDAKSVRKRLEARFAKMRERMNEDD